MEEGEGDKTSDSILKPKAYGKDSGILQIKYDNFVEAWLQLANALQIKPCRLMNNKQSYSNNSFLIFFSF